ncbi:TPA: hypothetical protein HA244_01075 [Candidatus Micrarchaeota archaeon]|nr:hypothetical protein [Candidatus Micrarchaeota archaeon]
MKFLAFVFVVALAFSIAGCLQEKTLDATGAVTGLPGASTAVVSPLPSTTPASPTTPTSTPTPAATATPTPLPTASTPTPVPTQALTPGTCVINTPRGQISFAASETVQLLVTFTGLPASINTASIKCEDSGTAANIAVKRSGLSVFSTYSCSYSPSSSRSYVITASTAGGTQCTVVVSVNVVS